LEYYFQQYQGLSQYRGCLSGGGGSTILEPPRAIDCFFEDFNKAKRRKDPHGNLSMQMIFNHHSRVLYPSRQKIQQEMQFCMAEDDYRILPVVKGRVQCLPEKKEPVENCGFCVHCREFGIGPRFVKSPSLAYCTKCRVTERVDLTKVTAVKCADHQGGGFHSITNIIS
jgi:hypothetical protein